MPAPATDTPDVNIIWDTKAQTDLTIKTNKPDNIFKNKKRKKRPLIDVSVPSDCNINQIEAEKHINYTELQIETN